MTRWRRRRRFRTFRWPTLLAIVVLIALVIADRHGLLLTTHADEMNRYHDRSFVVARVVDGDTIEINAFDPVENRPTTRVRLWGIDCPEKAGAGRSEPEPWAIQATALTEHLTTGGTVRLTLEPHRLRGRYGRVLAHIHTANGLSINELLLEAGLAHADDSWPHAELQRYAEAERRARDASLGIWSE